MRLVRSVCGCDVGVGDSPFSLSNLLFCVHLSFFPALCFFSFLCSPQPFPLSLTVFYFLFIFIPLLPFLSSFFLCLFSFPISHHILSSPPPLFLFLSLFFSPLPPLSTQDVSDTCYLTAWAEWVVLPQPWRANKRL